MRVLLSIVTCLAISISSYVQDKITESFKLGDKGFSIIAYQLFNGSKEHTFYEIKDGVLHYYYVSMYEGKYIQYNHASVAIKSLDLKNVSYSQYAEESVFMYLKTKKTVKDVKFEGYTKMSGPDLIVKNKNEFKIELVLNSEVQGEELVKLLKKNK